VVASNELLLEHPSMLWDDPCGNGWIACVRPTRFEEEAGNCRLRSVVLANGDQASACEQLAQLRSLGCQVALAAGVGEVGPALQQEPDCNVLMMDAESFGREGPELVGRIRATTPLTRVVVIAARHCKWESAYREQGIFYYAIDPFGDNEIADIVDAAFRPQSARGPQVKPPRTSGPWVSRICITRPDAKKVDVAAGNGLLRKDFGLGRHMMHRLAEQAYSVEMALGGRGLSQAIEQARSSCERVLILLARDTGRLPGSLVREELVPAPGEQTINATNLIIQRASSTQDPLDFDPRTTAALAEHIVQAIATC
jgi:CheY-like chemotaxis protein